jgi:hypothetical protein
MSDGGSDLGSAILEAEHEVDIGSCAQYRGSFRPQSDDSPNPGDAERWESRVVDRCVENYFTTLVGHGRPPIGEPSHVIGVRRLEPSGAERTAGVGKIGARLARPHYPHGRAEMRIDAPIVASAAHDLIVARFLVRELDL